MASADLDYIRALLIAQTAEPEPRAKGPLRGLFGAKRDRRRPAPLAVDEPGRPSTATPFTDADQELLLGHICGPILPVEAGPPTPRAEFGRRPDAAAEIELMLVQPAAEPRRLRVTDDAGAPIGEMIFHPSDPPVRAAYASSDDTPAVPYFPEDLFEPEPEFGATEPEPLRPWIKALRNSGGARPKPVAAQAEHPAPAVPKTYLGHDLLAALAVSLMREHTALKDRIARTRVGPHAQAA